MYVPPTYPEYSENPEFLRIIGGDDRFQIFNTKVFPWSTVVKINGQWNQNSFLIA